MRGLVLRLLGEFEVRQGGRGRLSLRLAKARGLLAYVALCEGRLVSRGRLCALLWSRVGESHARQSLRQALADIRRALGSAACLVVAREDAVGLDCTRVTSDVALFERLAAAPRKSALIRAARLYRGSLLDGLDLPEPGFTDWRDGELRRLDALARTVLSRLYDLCDRDDAAIPLALASRLVTLDPYDEAVHRALMTLYARCGAKSQALRQFEICRRHLRHGLDQEPSPETMAVYDAIRRTKGDYGCAQKTPPRPSYLVEAGDWALRAYVSDDAVRHYRRALAALDNSHAADLERLTVLERLADLLGTMGQRDEALRHYQALSRTLAATGDAIGQARLHRKVALLHWEAGDRSRAAAVLRRAFKFLQDNERSLERAYLCHEMGRLAFRSGDNRGALDWAERAIAEAGPFLENDVTHERPNTTEVTTSAALVLAEARNTSGVAKARLGEVDEATSHVKRSLEIAEAHDLLQAACRACANLAVLYADRDPARAIEISRRGLEIAGRIGDLAFQSRLYTNLGVALCTFHVRRDKDGVEAMKKSIELDRQLNLVDHLPMSLIALGQIHQCHGLPRQAIGYYREALPLAEELDEPQILFPCYDGLATALLEIDDLAGARTYFRKAQAVCRRAGLDSSSLLALPFLC